MQLTNYILLGIAWIVACTLLGLYIRGRGLTGKKQYRIGFKVILISYLTGLGLLFYIMIHS